MKRSNAGRGRRIELRPAERTEIIGLHRGVALSIDGGPGDEDEVHGLSEGVLALSKRFTH